MELTPQIKELATKLGFTNIEILDAGERKVWNSCKVRYMVKWTDSTGSYKKPLKECWVLMDAIFFALKSQVTTGICQECGGRGYRYRFNSRTSACRHCGGYGKI